MPRLRRTTLVIALAVGALASACSSGDTGGATATPNSLLTTIASVEGTPPPAPGESDPPTATVTVGGGPTAGMRVGTYCWSGICADAIGIVTPIAPITAPAGGKLTFAGPAFDLPRSSTTLQLWPLPDAPVSEGADWQAWQPGADGTTLALDGTGATVPAALARGQYLAALFLSFAGGGDAGYGIVIDIAP